MESYTVNVWFGADAPVSMEFAERWLAERFALSYDPEVYPDVVVKIFAPDGRELFEGGRGAARHRRYDVDYDACEQCGNTQFYVNPFDVHTGEYLKDPVGGAVCPHCNPVKYDAFRWAVRTADSEGEANGD